MIIDPELCSYDRARRILTLDFRGCLGGNDMLFMLSAWDDGYNTWRKRGKIWAIDYPIEFPFLQNCFNYMGRDYPINQFIERIPAKIRHQVSIFKAKQNTVLNVLARHTSSFDLLNNFPTLLWLASNSLLKMSTETAESCIRMKYSRILDIISGNGSKLALNVLKKIVGINYNINDHETLIALLKNEKALHALKHCSSINWTNLYKAMNHHDFYLWKAAKPLIESKDILQLCNIRLLINDTLRLGKLLDVPETERVIKKCSTIDKIRGLHTNWSKRVNMANEDSFVKQHGDFLPRPPLPGTINIIPVNTVRKLLREGAEMHHCVAGYINRIRNGQSYIYSVLSPQRATLEIEIAGKDSFKIAQIKLICNQNPSIETVRFVHAWLRKQIYVI